MGYTIKSIRPSKYRNDQWRENKTTEKTCTYGNTKIQKQYTKTQTNTQGNNFMLYVSTNINIKTNIYTNKITEVALYHGR